MFYEKEIDLTTVKPTLMQKVRNFWKTIKLVWHKITTFKFYLPDVMEPVRSF